MTRARRARAAPRRAARALPRLSARSAFFLDIDGTLLEIGLRPERVRVDSALLELLAELQRAAGGALALVSGRSIAAVDALFAPLLLPVAGQHGSERRDAAGRVHRHAVARAPLRRAAARLRTYAAAHPGLVLEDKGVSLALHYRLAPRLAGEVRATMGALAASLGDSFELQGGKLVLELKPGGQDKGSAIEEFMREAPFRGRTPVFAGDDLTDEHGFSVVNRRRGHAIKVGAGASAARWRLPGPRVLRAFLGAWIARVASAAAPSADLPRRAPRRAAPAPARRRRPRRARVRAR